MFLWILFLMVVAWTIMFRFRRRNLYKLAAKIPEPAGALPLIGLAHKLSGDTEDIMSCLQKFSYASHENDGIIKVWLNHILYFVTTNPVDLELVLKACLEKDDLHRFITNITGDGAIFAPVAIWRKRRKILVPAFRPKVVESFVEVFSEQSEKFAKRLTDRADKQKFSVWPFVNTYTLNSVFETVMGFKINAPENSESGFLKALNRILNLICERIFHLWLQPEWMFKLFPQYKEQKTLVKEIFDFVDNIIALKRKELKTKKDIKTKDVLDLETYERKSFLDLLISLSGGEKGYNNIELREEVLTLTVAGTDTSATAVGYTLMVLGKYPEVQERVYKEIYQVFGDTDRALVKDDLLQLKYLERVVKESLRLFPPVPFIIRKVLEDIRLPSGRELPAGSGIVVSIWGVHRDPKYWGPDAEHFDPDRFLPERLNLAHACSYMPFSNGPRNCLGYQYAMMSIKTALTAVLRRFRVLGDAETSPIPQIRVKLDIMMKAVDGYEIALERRKPEEN